MTTGRQSSRPRAHACSLSGLHLGSRAVSDSCGIGTWDQLRRFIDAEQPLPDELIAALVLRRLDEPDATGGFVFWASDATPLPLLARSLEPPEILVVELALADADVTRRMTGRRLCRHCGKVWHIESASTHDPGVCDLCGGGLIQRRNDAAPAVARRLSVYRERSGPILDRCRAAGRLISIDAARPGQEIAADLIASLSIG